MQKHYLMILSFVFLNESQASSDLNRIVIYPLTKLHVCKEFIELIKKLNTKLTSWIESV